VLFDRPLSATLLAITALLILLMLLPSIRKTRDKAFEGEQD
jgi:putative tricarboxylic transport membrane protein